MQEETEIICSQEEMDELDKIDIESEADNVIDEYGDSFNISLLCKYKILTREEEVEMLQKIRSGDKDAHNEFFMRNMRLVVYVANMYKNVVKSMDLDDLIQEGMFGLETAIERFDPEKANKFSTYAAIWIKQKIRRAISNEDSLIRRPVHVDTQLWCIKRDINELEKRYNRDLTSDEINDVVAKIAGSPTTATTLKDAYLNRNLVSLSAPVSGSDGAEDSEYGDFLAAPDSTEDKCFANFLNEDINRAMEAADLTEKEKDVLRMRYGIKDGNAYTLEMIGQKYGVTRERIRQIETRAIKKMRSQKAKALLEDYVPYRKNRKLEGIYCETRKHS